MEAIRILLVDDHQVVREGLRRMLELETDLRVVGEAADADAALIQADSLLPEIILMDIKMNDIDGIELTRQITKRQPDSNIIMLTLYDEYLPQAIEAGAKGYLLKDIKREELVRAIRTVKHGRSPLNMSLSQEQFAGLTAVGPGEHSEHLTERELTIIQLAANGVKTREMANQLFLSEASVKRSMRLIFEKLDVHNRSEAVAEALKKKLI
ncbi:response regulator [Chloroflexota bacterium]